jgi:hypothetical protein
MEGFFALDTLCLVLALESKDKAQNTKHKVPGTKAQPDGIMAHV